MKLLIITLLVIAVHTACNNASTSLYAKEDNLHMDTANEQQAIMSVIEKETTSFFARDYEGWQSTRARKEYDFQGWNNADGTFDVANGWQYINAGIKDYIDKNSIPIATKPEVVRRNMQWKFYGNSCAYLTWDEYVREDTSQAFYKSKALRLLEKQDGGWKIVSVASFWDYKNKITRKLIQ